MDCFAAPGILLSVSDLNIPKAKALGTVLNSGRHNFVRLVECRRDETTGVETIVLEAIIERPQVLAHAIEAIERVSVTFEVDDLSFPEILALRRDFPEVPHINYRPSEFPRSLCLYEQSYAEAKSEWTPMRFVQRLREWFTQTARGELHKGEQPLEPILPVTANKLVIPSELFLGKAGDKPKLLDITGVRASDRVTLFATESGKGAPELRNIVIQGFIAVFHSQPVVHGPIRREPKTFFELHQFCSSAGLNLLAELREALATWNCNGNLAGRFDRDLFLVIVFPVQRKAGGDIEGFHKWGFHLTSPIRKIGTDLGIWADTGKHLAPLIQVDEAKCGADINVAIIDPINQFSAESAAHLSGELERYKGKIAAIGLGALGSHVFVNLMRSGFGQWTLIDNDVLLPHNLARHALLGVYVGHSKAESMVNFAQCTFLDASSISTAIVEDVLVGTRTAECVSDSDLILDMSASVAVARHLTLNIESKTRRASAFLAPSGRDLVFIAESKDRQVRLDHLEYQYYRAVIADPRLDGHLTTNVDRTRYAQSCRDITSVLPQELVALQAAIASRAIKQLVSDDRARLRIWRSSDETLQVSSIDVELALVEEVLVGGWKICADDGFLEKAKQARLAKLPNETGGLLLGSIDIQRKLIYVADFLESPKDSVEEPTSYIRGSKGLRAKLEEVERITLGRVTYIGEWHSHPDGSPAQPSGTDQRALAQIVVEMEAEQMPALMMIVGDRGEVRFVVGFVEH